MRSDLLLYGAGKSGYNVSIVGEMGRNTGFAGRRGRGLVAATGSVPDAVKPA